MSTQIALPRFARIGAGAVDEIGAVIDQLGLHRPVLVTDKYLVSTGVADRILDILRVAGKDPLLFDGTVPDPTTDSLVEGLRAVNEHDADSVIGFGGGSPMDTAKALAVLSAKGGRMRDYKAPHVYTGPALPIIAIPTTAGSGSEATQFTVISDSASDEKMLCPGLSFLPIAAIIDFELTTSMPPRLTADTGVDALTHAIEAYVSRKANPFSDGLALAAIHTIGKNIRRAYADGEDRVAREAMMIASTQAGMAFSNASVALVHGMSRPIGAHFHVAHGLSNAMLLPAITRFSVRGAESRYADCARAYGVVSESATDNVATQFLVDALTELCHDLKVPTPLAYGIDRNKWDDLIPLMARQALESGSPGNNPVVPTASEIETLYAEVFE
ncbi:iron-containing alcohol dehydrogenase [Rhodococcus opacus]|uniref:iron-containing alcohol dehydrogenase n=1 Tax=Rhodococcus opacus TaxID=37919 RepID=UPI0002A1D961|nr:iron-containing alcohol dehydrogenase [Rhodococcus opacus]ELB90774.1 iron-containing alcohol dehydrogenase [Rhodococcus wratislaviensis IFP 2016]MDX5965287.1 iron-containing alcohol dehydrogenase [Rhodococcus opacus]NKY76718.1 iron-containing alcohol dehydrogenase [Rhodococcus opacus]CAG7618668.1 Alcohol dehydrogenase 2 [Rhodococcus opacus]